MGVPPPGVFWSGVVGPGTNDELSLARAFSRGTHRLPNRRACSKAHFVNEIGFFQEFLMKNVFIRACY